MEDQNCPCGSQNTYAACCGKSHHGVSTVKTAEALMRSRYSAFVKADGDYLSNSHHSTKRPTKHEMKEIVQWAKSVQWVQLEVLNTAKGSASDTEGVVEFKAYYVEQGKPNVIYEKSRFVKENGHWVYLHGKHV